MQVRLSKAFFFFLQSCNSAPVFLPLFSVYAIIVDTRNCSNVAIVVAVRQRSAQKIFHFLCAGGLLRDLSS